ncbi:MAG TPA: sigma-54 dependent transcriptional regulator [Candidatus Acidoferrales bacterium]|nr:sigma-54 dependent transcriptional regulator [Candidatus Acidoferrales bacterium]
MSTVTRQAILVVDDEPSSVELLRITLGMEYQVYTATDGLEGLKILAEHDDITLAIVDQRMPGMSGTEFIQRTIEPYPQLIRIILTGYTDVDSLIQAINAGSVYRYLTKPWEKEDLAITVRRGLEAHRLAADNARLRQELERANERLRVENANLRRDAKGRYRFEEIIGSSACLERMLSLVDRVVATDSTVLISGETGTGKELIARAIHYNGRRADKPFVSENCGAIASDLLTSELFGHKRGAFTGAGEDRQGLFEVADGGTLFLDEIGDCPPELQTRLLRVLDQGEIRRVGDSFPIKVDVRIIAATNHDLEEDVRQGRFRKDLFYRLSVFSIIPPPLRERRDDIPVLVQHFLDRLTRRSGKRVAGFSLQALEQLASYDFPGNVRELENEIERAFALADEDFFITPDLLSPKFNRKATTAGSDTLHEAVERLEARYLQEALAKHSGNQTRAAAELGISRRALFDKLQKYGVKVR